VSVKKVNILSVELDESLDEAGLQGFFGRRES
jgi:hypothetical protein